IKDCIIDGKNIEKLEFSHVLFSNVIFLNVSFTNMVLTDVTFQNCDVSNADFMGANMHRVEWIDSKLVGINLADSHFQHVRFENCNLQLGAFGYGSFKHVQFKECMMHNADCYE